MPEFPPVSAAVGGLLIGLAAAMFKIPVLAFAVGVYLPLSTMGAVFLGGLMRHLLTRSQSPEEAERRREKGVLFGSGLVGGGGLTGVVLALWVAARGATYHFTFLAIGCACYVFSGRIP